MSHQIYYRIFGYVVTLLLHLLNLSAMSNHTKSVDWTGDADYEKIKRFRSLEYRFFTTWNVGLQIGYAALGLFCDSLILLNSNTKNYRLPKFIGASRDIMFSGLVWPSTWLVFTVFWGLFTYDRSLIFPLYLDKALTTPSNHVIHTAIIPIVLWEIMFRPRNTPRSHIRNLMQLTLHLLVYACVLHFTYIDRGVWLYPIFGVAYGTIHFLLLHVYICILCLIFYYLQWIMNYMVHGSQEKVSGKVQ